MDSKQVVLITGSSTGFGRLFAETLSRHGHTVFATMRDPEGRNFTNASDIRALAGRELLPLHVLELDVTDDASVDRAVRALVDQAGRIDVAINNAGYGIQGPTEAVTTQQASHIMNTNFFGAVRVNRAVLPHMRSQHHGLLVHISSGAGRLVIPSMGHYCASKFALEALAEAYSYELAAQGIESVIVEPGPHQTAAFDNMVQAADSSRTDTYGAGNDFASKLGGVFANSAGDPQEVADTVLRIVETPAGQRRLRYRVSPSSLGVDQINALCESVQARVLAAFGMTEDTKFVHRKATGTA
jgi:NAD(P)-dependent dehydrogenase (short-subunit alcohol dehydrogenase family)